MRISRREVLSGLSVIGLSAGLLGGRRTARASTDDYRALVCVFLYGGNDGNNMVVPLTTTEYNAYAAARSTSGLAIANGSLLPITPLSESGQAVVAAALRETRLA